MPHPDHLEQSQGSGTLRETPDLTEGLIARGSRRYHPSFLKIFARLLLAGSLAVGTFSFVPDAVAQMLRQVLNPYTATSGSQAYSDTFYNGTPSFPPDTEYRAVGKSDEAMGGVYQNTAENDDALYSQSSQGYTIRIAIEGGVLDLTGAVSCEMWGTAISHSTANTNIFDNYVEMVKGDRTVIDTNHRQLVAPQPAQGSSSSGYVDEIQTRVDQAGNRLLAVTYAGFGDTRDGEYDMGYDGNCNPTSGLVQVSTPATATATPVVTVTPTHSATPMAMQPEAFLPMVSLGSHAGW